MYYICCHCNSRIRVEINFLGIVGFFASTVKQLMMLSSKVFIIDASWGFEGASLRIVLHGSFWNRRLDGTVSCFRKANYVKIERLGETSVPGGKMLWSTLFYVCRLIR